jgi:hypothetical protein
MLSYDALVTDMEFWRAIGEELMLIRTRRGWTNPTDVMNAGGGYPNYSTIQANERGDIGNLKSLTRHAQALDVSLVDVVRRVLTAHEARDPVPAEALRVLRKYQSTTVEGKIALVAIASALPDAAEEIQTAAVTSRRPPAAPRAAAPPLGAGTQRGATAAPRGHERKRTSGGS